jgi:phosphatidylglycerophosphate synthase
LIHPLVALRGPASVDGSQLIELTDNPADRLWRYPICKGLVKLALKTPVTPNQVTIFHGILGLATGAVISIGTPGAFVVAGLMYETRSVLDCLDGTLARAKKISSPFGRALDQMADAVGFLSLMAGASVCLARQYGWGVAAAVVVLTTVISSGCTTAWDQLKRRFTSLIAQGYDSTEDDYVVLCRRYEERPVLSLWVSRAVSFVGILTLSPHSLPRLRERVAKRDWPHDGETRPVTTMGRTLQDAAARNDPELRGILLRIGVVAGDNLILLLTVGLLAGQYLLAFPIVMAWGLLVWIYTVVSVGRYLQGAERESARGI